MIKNNLKFLEIDGERLKVIALNEEYLDDFHEYSMMSELYEHLEFHPFENIKETTVYFNNLVKRSDGTNGYYWFIFHKIEKKVIGTIGLTDIDMRKKSAELGYGLSPNYFGKGFFSEALKLILDWIFANNVFHRLFVKTSANNHSSIKAVMKLGFKKEGVMREFYLDEKSNERWDAVILSILKTDYN